MDDADRLELTELFVAALVMEVQSRPDQKATSIPMDVDSFAQSVVSLSATNPVAASFPVFTTLSGPNCPDFQAGMAIAQSVGLISRLNPSFHRFTVKITPREVTRLSKEAKFQHASELARQYLARALGSYDAAERERKDDALA